MLRKLKNKILISSGIIAAAITFLKIIPVPVAGITKSFGGFYFTSALYELSVKNYFGGIGSIALVLGLGISLNYINKNGKTIRN